MATDNSDLVRIVLIVLAVLVFGPMLLGLLMVPMMGRMGAWWVGGDVGGHTGWLFLWQLVPLLVLVAVAALGIRWLRDRDLGSDQAIEELRVAYAQGEIDEEEFERRKTVLEDGTD
ncbi:MAG: SHOCT domain-containing protein [Halobacteriaceae archaeon]